MGHQVFVISQPKRKASLKERVKRVLKGQGGSRKNNKEESYFDGLTTVNHRILEICRPVVDDDVPDADAIVATWWETAEWVARLSLKKGRKYYFVQHHEIHEHLPMERARATYSLPLQKITISRWLAKIMADEYGDTGVPIIPNSVDTGFFSSPVRGKNTEPTVGFMYSTRHYKGCDITIKALEILQARLPNIRILSFGSDPVTGELPLPANTEFHLRPPQPLIPEIYAACDCWIMGSRSEGFGLPLLESMACRTPVVASRAGAAPELLGQGGGVLLEENTPQAMAEAVLQILELAPDDWRQMSTAARRIATAFSWDDAASKLADVLQTAPLSNAKEQQR